MKITGTFLDEISHDIPSSNWDVEDWRRDFQEMQRDGVDTVILIRAGYKERCAFDSRVLGAHRRMRPCYVDLVDMFLQLAQDHKMSFYFGTYDSGDYWLNNQPAKEIALNIDFTSEFLDRYGHRKAFAGWYISNEIYKFDEAAVKVYEKLATHLRGLKELPILISPYFSAKRIHGDQRDLAEHEQQWRAILARIAGMVDIVAFQDGLCELADLADYTNVNARLAGEFKMTCWANVESFERRMAMNFLAISYQNLRYKMDVARAAGASKLITFEYSHFMSPNSIYANARNLSARYRQWAAGAESL